jgi:phospholipid/cholesterol/gamma-HCH transport system permease protein
VKLFLQELGGLFVFLRTVVATFFRTSGNFQPIVGQVAYVSFRSLSTIVFSGVFVGAILVLQFNAMLVDYDAQSLLGGLNTSSIVREVGPLIISFMLAGKIGAFTAAELGTMRVTEQIDAIECLGTDSIQYLIVPRFVGIVLSSIILLTIGLVIAIGASMLVGEWLCGVNTYRFTASIARFTDFWTLLSGFFKCVVYGIIVAGVCCYKGFTASGGAKGVGKAVTMAAIYTNFYIVIANYFCSKFLLLLTNVGKSLTQDYL